MKTALGILVAIIVVGGGYWWWQSSHGLSDDGTPAAVDAVDDAHGGDAGAQANASANTSGNLTGTVVASTGKTVTVTYDGTSFNPSTVTIKKGDTVKWVDTSGTMWVASAPHPLHTGYDGTTRAVHCAAGYSGPTPFDECAAGSSYSFTFGKVGTWAYHDHMNTGAFGKVIVQ